MSNCCGNKKQSTTLSKILDKVFVNDVVKAHRLQLCESCEHFNPKYRQCKLCGCFMDIKTKLAGFRCALYRINQEPLW